MLPPTRFYSHIRLRVVRAGEQTDVIAILSQTTHVTIKMSHPPFIANNLLPPCAFRGFSDGSEDSALKDAAEATEKYERCQGKELAFEAADNKGDSGCEQVTKAEVKKRCGLL